MSSNQPPEDRSKIPLNRVLGLPTGILLVAGIMIGSGAFKKIAPMSQSLMSEPWILLAWVIAGIITLFGAFTYAGLASMTTQSGGVYEYLRLCYGDFLSFLFGWMMFTIGGSGAIAALVFVFSQSVNTIIPFPNPLDAFKDVSIGNFLYPFAESGIKLFAILTIIILNLINFRGVKNGGVLNNIVTAAKILGILLLIIMGFSYSADVIKSEVITSTVPTGIALFSAFFGALLSALWAYDGWANITYITGEIKNPQRNVPLAITGGVLIAMTLYILLNYSYMKVLPVSELASIGENKVAAAEVAGVIMGNPGKVIISILIMTCTFGAVNACVMVYPRLYYRMAQEGSFFRKASFVHPTFRTPYISIIYSCAWSSILILSGTFDLLTNLVIFTGFLFFGAIALGLVKMKRKGIITTRVIGYPVIPIIILLFSLVLVVNTAIVQPQQSALGLLLVLSGIPFYYYFKSLRNKKRLSMKRKKEAIHSFAARIRRGGSMLTAVFLIFVFSLGFGQTNPYSTKFIRVDDYIDSLMKEWKVPGLALAIVYKDQLIYGRGYGYRDLDKKLPVETTTLFPIASNTKLFTSTVATMLQEEGKLNLDVPVKKYHPALNFFNDELNAKITLRDLLSHRTGLPGYNSIWVNAPYTRDELVSKIAYMKPALGFREGYIYNNMMYVTAGSVLEKITAKKWEDLVREKIFTPLGMNASCFTIEEMKKYGNYSLAYFEDDSTKKLKLKQYVALPDALGPAGTIKSTVEDMSRWMIVQLNSGKISGQQVIPAVAINQTLVPNSIADREGRWPELSNGLYGLGRIIQTYKGLKITNHTGSIDGYYSNLTFVPEKELAVFIVYNAVEAGSLRTVINLPVIDRLLDLSPTPWISRYKTEYLRDKARNKQLEDSVKATQVKNTNPTHALQAYTGTYTHPAYGEIKIQIQNNQLVFIFRSQQSLLYHFHYNQFITKEEKNDIPNFRISFFIDNKGKIDRLTMDSYGDSVAEFVKKL